MLKTDRNVKCVKLHLQSAVPTPELQILDLQVLVASLLFLVTNVTIKKLKPALKTFCTPCMKDSAKETLLSSLEGYSERKIVYKKR